MSCDCYCCDSWQWAVPLLLVVRDINCDLPRFAIAVVVVVVVAAAAVVVAVTIVHCWIDHQ